MENSTSRPKRVMCQRCERPASACVCSFVVEVVGEAELLILQHPMEAGHAKGSGRLLQLSVSGSRLLRGERFDADQLELLFHGGGRTPVLLFPDTGDSTPPAPTTAPSSLRLVVLDGTWRKCRKMLYLNPMLAALPRLALKAPPPSRYRIRKAHADDQLSTLEATCHAFSELEGKAERYQPVLTAFDRFVAAHESLELKGRAS
jgi:DTW domain-containing protein YfiP